MKNITILCGKSSCGKDSIRSYLVNNFNYTPIISITSRPIREKEKDGVDYYFIKKEQFKELICFDKLIEYRAYTTMVNNKIETWYYGHKKFELDKDKKYIAILDLNGAKSFIKYFGKENCEVIYIESPSDIRKERAMKRGSFDITEWNRRLLDDNEAFSHKNREEIVDKEINNWNKTIKEISMEVLYG